MNIATKLPSGDAAAGGKLSLRARMRKSLRAARSASGYALLFLSAFFLFVWVFLPTDAIAWRISQEAKKRGFIVTVQDLSISPLGSATIEEVTWIYTPSRAGQIPETFDLDRVDIDVSLWRLLLGELAVEIDAYVTDSDAILHAEYTRGGDESAIKIVIQDLPLAKVPKFHQMVGTPLTGLFGLKVDLKIPKHKLVKSEGTIEITCSVCTISDGETPMFIPGVERGAAAKGVTLPTIDFGSLGGVLVVSKGVAKTEGIEASSKDLELKITGEMALKDPFVRSRFKFRMKFFATETLLSRSERLRLIVATVPAKSKLDEPDIGWVGYQLLGSVGRPNLQSWKYKTKAQRDRERRERSRERQAELREQRSKRKKKKKKKKKKRAPIKIDSVEKKLEPKDRDDKDDAETSVLPTVAAAAAMNRDQDADSTKDEETTKDEDTREGEGDTNEDAEAEAEGGEARADSEGADSEGAVEGGGEGEGGGEASNEDNEEE